MPSPTRGADKRPSVAGIRLGLITDTIIMMAAAAGAGARQIVATRSIRRRRGYAQSGPGGAGPGCGQPRRAGRAAACVPTGRAAGAAARPQGARRDLCRTPLVAGPGAVEGAAAEGTVTW